MPYFYPVQRISVLLLLALCFITSPGRSAVASVRAMPSLGASISIKWKTIEGASSYVIEQAITPDGVFARLATVTAPITTYRHTGLGYSQKIYYRIKSYNGNTLLGTSEVVQATTHPEGYVYRIMPLGDSNTFGTKFGDDNEDGTPITPYAERVAYREELEKLLQNAGITFDFVGSEKAGGTYMTDTDNAGFPGARDEDIASLLEHGYYTSSGGKLITGTNGPYLPAYQPDIILLHIGTNAVDGSANNMDDLTQVLNQIDSYEESTGREVTVILAKILQRVCYTENGTEYCPNPEEAADTFKYNKSLQDLASKRIAAGDRMVLVDMERGAGIDFRYADLGGEMADYLHAAASGYKKMAKVWFDALSEELRIVPLPVELVSFKAQVAQDNVLLLWKTASEKDNSHFAVERMQEGGQFKEIGTVKGVGNSQLLQSYSFTDNTTPTGTLYYRLKQVDHDGSYEYSNVVALTRNAGPAVEIVYPNPGNGTETSLRVSGFAANEALRASVTDVMGKEVNSVPLTSDHAGVVNAGITFPVPLPEGLYILQVIAPGRTVKLKLVVEQ